LKLGEECSSYISFDFYAELPLAVMLVLSESENSLRTESILN
jgi:hypothetical protein